MTFDKRITILREHKNGVGSFADTEWVPEKTLRANWVNVHGSEAWVADSLQAVKPATVTVRYGRFSSTIDETCRIFYKGACYDIVSINNVREENRLIEMKVKAAVNG